MFCKALNIIWIKCSGDGCSTLKSLIPSVFISYPCSVTFHYLYLRLKVFKTMDYQRSKLEQESFLAKKKAEILARKNAAKTTPSSTSTTSNSAKSTANTAPTPQLPFANDGSFLEKFMAMQKAQQQKQPNKESESSKQGSSLVKLENKSTSSFSKAKPAPKLSKPAAIFEKEDQSGSISTFL